MTILLVDSFDVFSEDKMDSGAKLCVGRSLPTGALSPAFTADAGCKATLFDRVSRKGEFSRSGVSDIGEFTQRLIVVVADISRGHFIG